MIIVDKIRAILNTMLPPENPVEGADYVKTVFYTSSWDSNLRIDRKPTPLALLLLISDWTIDISRGTKKESGELQVFFADRAKFDSTGEQKDVIVKRMEELATEFIAKVMADKSIRIIDDSVKMRSSYGSWDTFVVGVSVTMRIEEKRGSCLPEPTIPTPEPEPEDGNDDQNEP